MLDLIIFASAAVITKYISQRNPLLTSSDSSQSSASGNYDENKNDDTNLNHHAHAPSLSSIQRRHNAVPIIHRITRYIFQFCLLISLLLFALSILEVAPIRSIALLSTTSDFISCYRTLLWILCILLLFVHPAFLGVVLGASLFDFKRWKQSSNTTFSPSVSLSPSRTSRYSTTADARWVTMRPIKICLNILWIATRFFLVISWRLCKKIIGMIIPYRITRANNNNCTGGIGGYCRSGARNVMKCCSMSMVMSAFISLAMSLLSLATIGSLILHFDTTRSGSGGIISTDAIPFRVDESENEVESIFDYLSLKYMVSIICAFGMIVASLLNGFGCASLPHSNLVGVFLQPTSLSVITKIEEDLSFATKTLEEKRWMLADVTQQQRQQQEQRSSPTRRLQSSSYTPSKNKISAEKQRVKQLQDEVLFLENLVSDMTDDIVEMKQSHQVALDARTTFGRIRGILGVVFSVVLVIRVILAANSFMPRKDENSNTGGVQSFNKSRDPLTSLLLWLVGQNIVKNAEQYDLFRQATSLILAGVLSLSQVRAFFRVVGALGRRLSRTCGVSLHSMTSQPGGGEQGTVRRGNDIALLLSSFVMGCYMLACVTVVKMNLPIEFRSSFSSAVGLSFSFNTTLLNTIFFASACVSALILASLFGIQRDNSARYQLEELQTSSLASLQMA